MLRFAASGALLLILSLLAAGAEAQIRVQAAEGGWIGIQVEGRALPDGSTRVMIVRVDRGSPAQQAGVRPFDLLVRLDGADVSPEALVELGERLRPGLPIELTVLRANRERTLRVTAGTRPDPMDAATMEEFTARVDSARLQILRMVDSLMADTTWVRFRTDMEAARRAMVEQAEASGELEAAAEAVDRVREMMVRAREAMRSQRFGPRPPGGRPPARVRITVDEAGPDQRGGRAGPPARGRITVDGGGIGERRGPGGRPGVRFRSPYLLGDRFVAGAELEVVELDVAANPGAEGRRFQVVQVVEGSPAYRAGLAPEDVIVSIGGEPASSLTEFRIRLGRLIRRGRPEMQVVRGDTTLVVILPRQ
ncbi:MAG: PDZ domain-containing protein [Gammaproteobacteria bacterium]|nr:PDZ domain-containing protein [Gammaproteobacteria bacterium]MYC51466.1 PDZ domain-containing protein [Gammaproteobacteria bacterium]